VDWEGGGMEEVGVSEENGWSYPFATELESTVWAFAWAC
jgi:hypothetical protein